jgi:hypothetical protein
MLSLNVGGFEGCARYSSDAISSGQCSSYTALSRRSEHSEVIHNRTKNEAETVISKTCTRGQGAKCIFTVYQPPFINLTF